MSEFREKSFESLVEYATELQKSIQQLEAALREARVTLYEILSGQEDSPLVSWEVVENIDAALSPSEENAGE